MDFSVKKKTILINGLLLAKELSQALGGNLILAKSTQQVGSVFVCTIKPLSAKWNIPQKAASEQKANADISLTNVKILVVDDSEDNRFLLCHILQNTGATTTETDNGQNAVNSVLQNNFDVILMDLQMPVMDGWPIPYKGNFLSIIYKTHLKGAVSVC